MFLLFIYRHTINNKKIFKICVILFLNVLIIKGKIQQRAAEKKQKMRNC